MKTIKSIIKFLFIIILGLGFWRCSEEEDEANPPAPNTLINFTFENQTLSEAGDPLKVNLTLSPAAVTPGTVAVRLSGEAGYLQRFTTSPEATQGTITLPIEKGQTTVFFTVIPVNDDDLSGNTTITFSLENPATGFKLGNKVTSVVALAEDDEPGNGGEVATIEFGENFVHISESDIEGYDISMLLQGSVTYTEPVFIKVLSAGGFEYGTDFITEPFTMQNNMKLEVYPGMEDLKFRVIPINDQLLSGSFELKFSLPDNLTQLVKGQQDTMTVRIEEDDIIDPATLHTIADLRSKFEAYEGDWYLPNDYYIEGVITSEANVIDDKAIYIQDATGGILLVFNGPKLLHKGDKVQVNLKNATGKEVNGQKAMMGVADRAGITVGRNFEVAPEIITLEQLHSGNYQGKRVRLQNVTFTAADGILTWLGEQRISDGNKFGYVNTYATASFSQQVLPSGKLTITGIVGDWNRIQPQDAVQDVPK